MDAGGLKDGRLEELAGLLSPRLWRMLREELIKDGQLDELARLLSPRLWRLLRRELIRERERVGRVRDRLR